MGIGRIRDRLHYKFIEVKASLAYENFGVGRITRRVRISERFLFEK